MSSDLKKLCQRTKVATKSRWTKLSRKQAIDKDIHVQSSSRPDALTPTFLMYHRRTKIRGKKLNFKVALHIPYGYEIDLLLAALDDVYLAGIGSKYR